MRLAVSTKSPLRIVINSGEELEVSSIKFVDVICSTFIVGDQLQDGVRVYIFLAGVGQVRNGRVQRMSCPNYQFVKNLPTVCFSAFEEYLRDTISVNIYKTEASSITSMRVGVVLFSYELKAVPFLFEDAQEN